MRSRIPKYLKARLSPAQAKIRCIIVVYGTGGWCYRNMGALLGRYRSHACALLSVKGSLYPPNFSPGPP